MRERIFRVQFTSDSWGNVKGPRGRFFLPRTGSWENRRVRPQAAFEPGYALLPVAFPETWHAANLRAAVAAAEVDGGGVATALPQVVWESELLLPAGALTWRRRRFKQGYTWHEAIAAGTVFGLSCRLEEGTEAAVVALLGHAGRYRGLSPWEPGRRGHFVVIGWTSGGKTSGGDEGGGAAAGRG